jgi:hypothetical protein
MSGREYFNTEDQINRYFRMWQKVVLVDKEVKRAVPSLETAIQNAIKAGLIKDGDIKHMMASSELYDYHFILNYYGKDISPEYLLWTYKMTERSDKDASGK